MAYNSPAARAPDSGNMWKRERRFTRNSHAFRWFEFCGFAGALCIDEPRTFQSNRFCISIMVHVLHVHIKWIINFRLNFNRLFLTCPIIHFNSHAIRHADLCRRLNLHESIYYLSSNVGVVHYTDALLIRITNAKQRTSSIAFDVGYTALFMCYVSHSIDWTGSAHMISAFRCRGCNSYMQLSGKLFITFRL